MTPYSNLSPLERALLKKNGQSWITSLHISIPRLMTLLEIPRNDSSMVFSTLSNFTLSLLLETILLILLTWRAMISKMDLKSWEKSLLWTSQTLLHLSDQFTGFQNIKYRGIKGSPTQAFQDFTSSLTLLNFILNSSSGKFVIPILTPNAQICFSRKRFELDSLQPWMNLKDLFT